MHAHTITLIDVPAFDPDEEHGLLAVASFIDGIEHLQRAGGNDHPAMHDTLVALMAAARSVDAMRPEGRGA